MIKTTMRDLLELGITKFSNGKTDEIISFYRNSDERLLSQECQLKAVKLRKDILIATIEDCFLTIEDYKLSLLEKELNDSVESDEGTNISFLKEIRKKLYRLRSKDGFTLEGEISYLMTLRCISEIIEDF